LRDSGICRSDTLYLDSKQIERDAWFDIHPFDPMAGSIKLTRKMP
jgi:hypothetical protein